MQIREPQVLASPSSEGHNDFFVAPSECFYLSRTIVSVHLMKLNTKKRDGNSDVRRRQDLLPPSTPKTQPNPTPQV